MVMAQNDVFDRHIETSIEFGFEPSRIPLAAAGRVNDDEAFIRNDDRCIRSHRPVHDTKYALRELDQPRAAVIGILCSSCPADDRQ